MNGRQSRYLILIEIEKVGFVIDLAVVVVAVIDLVAVVVAVIVLVQVELVPILPIPTSTLHTISKIVAIVQRPVSASVHHCPE